MFIHSFLNLFSQSIFFLMKYAIGSLVALFGENRVTSKPITYINGLIVPLLILVIFIPT